MLRWIFFYKSRAKIVKSSHIAAALFVNLPLLVGQNQIFFLSLNSVSVVPVSTLTSIRGVDLMASVRARCWAPVRNRKYLTLGTVEKMGTLQNYLFWRSEARASSWGCSAKESTLACSSTEAVSWGCDFSTSSLFESVGDWWIFNSRSNLWNWSRWFNKN